ncbi:hypothetical protein RND81_14G114900 [Saponaria officinalis]|uniref:Sec-independent protein translocase protein TATB, chloroplastic n=1 Tax=Saponaria officinalis TaxID=3572 RepID=A0AAW1GRD9_SAPOF
MSSSSTLCTVSFHGLSPTKSPKTTMFSLSFSSSGVKTLKFPIFPRFSQMGLCKFTSWDGLKYMGVSISPKPLKTGRKAKCRGKGVYASLFGVGAPEALVIGVVALLVFGPKGLAEVARNLGKTLRAFQPTIRELQDVSKEFKSTLEREIGLNDDPRSMRNPYESNSARSAPSSSVVEDFQNVPSTDPNGAPSSKAYSSEEYLKITEEQLKASAAVQQQNATSSLQESPVEPASQPQSQPTVASFPSEIAVEPESQLQASQEDGVPSPSESKIDSERQTEDSHRETATVAPSVEKPESEP